MYDQHMLDYSNYHYGCRLFGRGFPRPQIEAQALGWDQSAAYYREWIGRNT